MRPKALIWAIASLLLGAVCFTAADDPSIVTFADGTSGQPEATGDFVVIPDHDGGYSVIYRADPAEEDTDDYPETSYECHLGPKIYCQRISDEGALIGDAEPVANFADLDTTWRYAEVDGCSFDDVYYRPYDVKAMVERGSNMNG